MPVSTDPSEVRGPARPSALRADGRAGRRVSDRRSPPFHPLVRAARWIGLAVAQARHFLLSTASVSILGHEYDAVDESAIVLWNAASTIAFDSRLAVRTGDDERKANANAIERWKNEGGD